MMLLITYFQFILGLGLKERRGWTTLPLAYFVLSIARFIIIDNTVRTIRCLKILSLSTTVVVRIRIMEWSAFWTWSRREDSLVRILFIYILSSTQIMTVTTHLTALRCCTGRKMSLLLRIAVKFWIPEIMLNLFKCSLKTSLDWYHSWIISMTDPILKLSSSIMSSAYHQELHGEV